MKNFISFLLISFTWLIAQDTTYAEVNADSTAVVQASEVTSPVQRLNVDDYKKFYIGFTTADKSLEVITLNISDITPVDSKYTFNYTLNTHDNREDGEGEILPDKSLIRFQNLEEGRISIPEDGKIVFESVTQDSLKYWKLKEK